MKRWKRGLFLFVGIGIVVMGVANFAFCDSITLSTQLGAGGGLWEGEDTDGDANIDVIHPNNTDWLIDYRTAQEDQNGANITLKAQDGGSLGTATGTNGGNIILMPGSGLGDGTSGNVGIGTTNPGYKLQVDGKFRVNGDNGGLIEMTKYGSDTDKIELKVDAGEFATAEYVKSYLNLNPEEGLGVLGNAIWLESLHETVLKSHGDMRFWSQDSYYFFDTGAIYVMKIDSGTGNVGIGNFSPSRSPGAPLEVERSTAGAQTVLLLDNPSIADGVGVTTRLQFNNLTNEMGQIWIERDTNDFVFQNYNNGAFGDLLLNPGGGNVGIGTTTPGGSSTAGAKVLSLGDGTAPAGGVANQCSLYSASGELYAFDSGGNATLLSPHDKETGEWIFYSKNTKTGRVVKVDMERMVKAIERVTGEQFMVEKYEEVN